MPVLTQINNGERPMSNVRQTLNAMIVAVDPGAALIQANASIDSVVAKVNGMLAKLDLPLIASAATFFTAATRATLNTAIGQALGTVPPTPSPTPSNTRANSTQVRANHSAFRTPLASMESQITSKGA